MKRYSIIVFFLLSIYLSSYSQVFTDSNLPIVIITTDGNVVIPDSPRALASMKIIFRGEGLRNYISDQNTAEYLNYNGRINIEVRGSSSQTLPKKQYGFSTLTTDNITERNVSLLGLPADNDWILNGLGFEPSLIRDYLCYNLSRMIGDYASRTVYCEVILNGSYNGLYVLEEKIKQGSERVNIAKITTLDNSYPKVTGGYIVKADKTGGDPVAWTMSSYIGTNDVTFIYDYPKPEEISAPQSKYIQSVFETLRSTAATGNASIENGFPSVIDIPSFVDYMIINELGSNADAYQFSTFFHKDRNGKLRAGPIWDLNLTFGYDLAIWGYDRSKTDVWQFLNGDNEGPKFWQDLFNNPDFRCCLYKRWNQLIQPGQPLNYASIEALIDTTVAKISEAAVRENNRWGTVPNLSAEIDRIKNFLQSRIPWMTSHITLLGNCIDEIMPPLVITKIMYHPDSTLKFPDSDAQEFLEIRNTGSKTVSLNGVFFSGTGFVYQFPWYSEIFPNSVKILANKSDVFLAKYGFSPSGQFTRNLSNAGEKLVLADGFGNVIDSVSYSDHAPWPNADGNGYFLELIDPLSDNSLASNWRLSTNTILSVIKTESLGKLKFYPSPVKDMLTIETSGIIKSIELIDFQGRVLKKIDANSGIYKLDMSSCPQGIYLIQIFTPDGNYVQKILKE
jgi:hypothetical protein